MGNGGQGAGGGAVRARVVRSMADLDAGLLAEATTIGLVITADAPERLAKQIQAALSGLGPLTMSERTIRTLNPLVPSLREATPARSHLAGAG
jgi:hypothetical protein